MNGLNGLEMSQESAGRRSNSLEDASNAASDQDIDTAEQFDDDVGGLFGDASDDEELG